MIKVVLLTVFWSSGGRLRQAEADPQSKLAELPLDKLLNVKFALENDISRLLSETKSNLDEDVELEVNVDEEMEGEGGGEGPMPLRGDWFQMSKPRRKTTKLPDRRGDWDYEKGEKKGDVSNIFQTTVTILAFLAFGGYLLCMILMAIRNNQGFFQTTTTVAPAAGVRPAAGAGVRPAAGAGRRRRQINEGMWVVGSVVVPDTPVVEALTEGLHRLAEGYAKYHSDNK